MQLKSTWIKIIKVLFNLSKDYENEVVLNILNESFTIHNFFFFFLTKTIHKDHIYLKE